MNNRRYRHKLKKKRKERFSDQLLFLTTKLNTAEIAVSAINMSSYVLPDDTSCVAETARCLREDVLRYHELLLETSWLPIIEQLSTAKTELPQLAELLKTESHNPSRSENIGRLIQVHNITGS